MSRLTVGRAGALLRARLLHRPVRAPSSTRLSPLPGRRALSTISVQSLRDDDVCILSFARTPIGSFGGKLSHLSAVRLGALAIQAAVARAARLERESITDCFMGHVLQAGCGQAPARQAALLAALPDSVRCTTVNKVCASGMKAVAMAVDALRLGHADVVVAGGMESMSNAPFYLIEEWPTGGGGGRKPRQRRRLGNRTLIDGLLHDGLLSPASVASIGAAQLEEQVHMGVFADRLAASMGILREEQDNFAVHSYSRAAKATAQELFAKEIVAVEMPADAEERSSNSSSSSSSSEERTLFAAREHGRNASGAGGDSGGLSSPEHVPLMKSDEELERLTLIDRLPLLPPVFAPATTAAAATKDAHGADHAATGGGTITAGNASKISDGAAALVLASGRAVKRNNLIPLARVLSHADAEQSPSHFATSPALALPLALRRANLTLSDMDYIEINEAFACVPIMVMKVLAAAHAAETGMVGATASGALPRRLQAAAGSSDGSHANTANTATTTSAAHAPPPGGVPEALSSQHINAWGGAVALGHPLGCSGARILVTLTNILRSRTAHYGAAAICNGGGGASAMVMERLDLDAR
ncbi:hypothetical protein CDCA_CDCA12G3371 [Cyanidium caldarium]|uniref:acetyl-CoA C-acetyltransferase n=1 Tax=Cyanidium caldarium TaxID=2771 RepID=A0AAV9IZ10_CYACA|nr:hypothetical protein CDCA_CDCA12G3371 [Cyanidium caldarium]